MAIKDDLVSVWELNEASGDALDSHGSNTLTDNNTVGAGTGVIAGCRTFAAASSERFNMASNSSVLTGDIDFTVAAWVRLSSTSAVRSIMSKWTTSGNQREYWMHYQPTATDRFRFSVSSNGSTQSNAIANTLGAPSTGVWYWVVGGHSASGNVAWISVNNGTVDTVSHSTGVFTGTGDFFIGGIGASLYFDGDIDQVSLWKRDLRDTPSDMATLYNGGSGLAYSSWDGAAGTRRRQLLHCF